MKSDGINISIRKVVGVNAGRIRVQRGYSQTFAAERSGIDRSALNKFEVGKFNPSLEWLCKLADGLNVPVVEFFSGLEDARPSECAAVLMTDAGEYMFLRNLPDVLSANLSKVPGTNVVLLR